MKTPSKIAFCFTVLIAVFSSCGMDEKSIEEVKKFQASDEFINSITPSQFYKIDPKIDNVVEGENGTLLVIPKGCFLDANGNQVTTPIEVELTEALTLDQMLLSNLTTTADGALLQTDGMIYFNVTSDGKQVTIDPSLPIHIEIPTNEKIPGMQVYSGERDSLGNMNWTDPQEIESYLVNVDMDLLDFLPNGFENEVLTGLPYKGHTELSKELVDSLYYSFTTWGRRPQRSEKQSLVIPNEELLMDSIDRMKNAKEAVEVLAAMSINPSIIKVISSEDYQNTFFATREFEERLQYIFQSCNGEVLMPYLEGLENSMFIADSIAAVTLEGSPLQEKFLEFYAQKLGNVEVDDRYIMLLKKHFNKRLSKTKKELERLQKKANREILKDEKKAEKLLKEYKVVLKKREAHRMKSYGFKRTRAGWINIDIGTIEKDFYSNSIDVTVSNGADFKRVHSYVIYLSNKSLCRMNADNKSSFFVGPPSMREMLMPKEKKAVLICVAYDENDKPSWAKKEFITSPNQKLSVTLSKINKQSLATEIAQYDNLKDENKLSKELIFMKKFQEDKERREKLENERIFMWKLSKHAFPCGNLTEVSN